MNKILKIGSVVILILVAVFGFGISQGNAQTVNNAITIFPMKAYLNDFYGDIDLASTRENTESIQPIGNTFFFYTEFKGGPTVGDQKLFLHLVDSNGDIKYSTDIIPQLPTSKWWSGVSVVSATLTLPNDISIGTYKVMTGIYDGNTRIALNPATGVIADNQTRYQVGTLKIVPRDSFSRPSNCFAGYNCSKYNSLFSKRPETVINPITLEKYSGPEYFSAGSSFSFPLNFKGGPYIMRPSKGTITTYTCLDLSFLDENNRVVFRPEWEGYCKEKDSKPLADAKPNDLYSVTKIVKIPKDVKPGTYSVAFVMQHGFLFYPFIPGNGVQEIYYGGSIYPGYIIGKVNVTSPITYPDITIKKSTIDTSTIMGAQNNFNLKFRASAITSNYKIFLKLIGSTGLVILDTVIDPPTPTSRWTGNIESLVNVTIPKVASAPMVDKYKIIAGLTDGATRIPLTTSSGAKKVTTDVNAYEVGSMVIYNPLLTVNKSSGPTSATPKSTTPIILNFQGSSATLDSFVKDYFVGVLLEKEGSRKPTLLDWVYPNASMIKSDGSIAIPVSVKAPNNIGNYVIATMLMPKKKPSAVIDLYYPMTMGQGITLSASLESGIISAGRSGLGEAALSRESLSNIRSPLYNIGNLNISATAVSPVVVPPIVVTPPIDDTPDTPAVVVIPPVSDRPSAERPNVTINQWYVYSTRIGTNAQATLSSPDVFSSISYGINFQGGPTDGDKRVFVHFVDSNGVIRFKSDIAPSTPSSRWILGSNNWVTIETEVPSDIPTGTYTVYSGLYDGNRVTLNPGSGVTADSQTRYKVGTVTLSPAPVTSQKSSSLIGSVLGAIASLFSW